MSEAEMKKELFQAIDVRKEELLRIADYICDNPEVGLKEYKASVFLSEYLRQNGFSVELGVGGLDTAFRAVWENGTGGPSIGFLCEYDALEGIGHGCGHHLQGPSVVGAAVALRETLSPEQPCTIVIYGTPAEETEGGKIIMLENGCFRDIDIAMMMHASSSGTGVDLRTLALSTLAVEYRGKSTRQSIRKMAAPHWMPCFWHFMELSACVSMCRTMFGFIMPSPMAACRQMRFRLMRLRRSSPGLMTG